MLTSETTPPSGKVYRAKRGWMTVQAILILGIALFNVPTIAGFLNTGHAHDATVIAVTTVTILCTLLLVSMGIFMLVGILRGMPYLAIDTTGIRYKTWLGSMQAEWNSVAPFKLSERSTSAFYRMRPHATGSIIGSNVSKNLAKLKHFRISDQFNVKLEEIVAEINHARSMALGLAGDVPNAYVEQEAEIESLSQLGDPDTRTPWVTLGILAVIAAMYGAEQLFSVQQGGGALSKQVLMELGAMNRDAVLNGHEWYRLFTAMLLHANLNHLLFNGIALFFAGMVLEKLLGRFWYFSFFIIGGVCGSLMSMAMNPSDLVSVGASGAIMALFSALLVTSFRLPKGTLRFRFQAETLRVIIPALFPTGAHIDAAAHFGGFLAGVILALGLFRFLRSDFTQTPLQSIAKKLSIAGLVAMLFSVGCVVVHPHDTCAYEPDLEKAVAACTATLADEKITPQKRAQALLSRGHAYLGQEKFELALADVERSIAIDRNVQALVILGAIHAGLRKYEEGIQDFTQAILLVKKDVSLAANILALRATFFVASGNNNAAKQDIEKTLSLDPHNAIAKKTMGDIFFMEGNYASAITHYDQAILAAADISDFYLARGQTKLFQGKPLLAIEDIKQAAKLDPKNLYLKLWLKIAYAKAGQSDAFDLLQSTLSDVTDKWPRPIVDLYVDKLDPKGVLEKAQHVKQNIERDQTCEANFYIGEWYLQRGAMPIAKAYMKNAADACPIEFTERNMAIAELKNLEK